MNGLSAPQSYVAVSSSNLPVNVVTNTPSTCKIQDRQVVPIASGVCVLSASQPGNSIFFSASPVSVNFAISKATQALTFPTLNNSSFDNLEQPISASLNSGLAPTYSVNDVTICNVSNNRVIYNSVGTCIVTAIGNSTDLLGESSSIARSFTISKGSNSIIFSDLANMEVGDPDQAPSITVSSGLPAVLTSSTPSICSIISNKVHAIAAGECSVSASQPGNSNYSASNTVFKTISILGLLSQSISFNPAVMFVGEIDQLLSASASSGLAVSYAVGSGSNCSLVSTVDKTYVRADSAGFCSLVATQGGDATWASATSVTRSFQIALSLPQIWSGVTFQPFTSLSQVMDGVLLIPQGGDFRHYGTLQYKYYSCPKSDTTFNRSTGSSLPNGCNPTPLSTGSSYRIATSDIDKSISVSVTLTNAAGSIEVWSQSTSTVISAALQQILGSSGFRVLINAGGVLVADWSNFKSNGGAGSVTPGTTVVASIPGLTNQGNLAISYQWFRCAYPQVSPGYSTLLPTSATLCEQSSLTGSAITVTPWWDGSYIAVRVFLNNVVGFAQTQYPASSQSPDILVNPTISGNPVAGQSLSLYQGIWTSYAPVWNTVSRTVSYWKNFTTSGQILVCLTASQAGKNISPSGCSPSNGTLSANGYVIADEEIGKYIGYQITATAQGSGRGSTTWWTGTVGPVTGTAPTLSNAPALPAPSAGAYSKYSIPEGISVPAVTFRAHPANPTLSYEWFMCTSPLPAYQLTLPSNCSATPISNNSMLFTQAAYADLYPLLKVRAQNDYGSIDVYLATKYQIASPPINTQSPTITSANDGTGNLILSSGTWAGNPAPTFVYKWAWCYKGTVAQDIRTAGGNQNCWIISTGMNWKYDAVNYGNLEIAGGVFASNSYSLNVETWTIWAR